MLAVGLSEMLCICDVDFKHSSKIVRIDRDNKLCSLKFNTKGDYTKKGAVFSLKAA